MHRIFNSGQFFHKPIFGWVLVSITFALALLAWFISVRLIEEKAAERFRFRTLEVKNAIQDRMRDYKQVLRSGEALYSACDTVSREQWSIFVQKLKLQQNFPGIQGMGYIKRVHAEQLDNFQALIKAEGFRSFKVWPSELSREYFPVLYIEPFKGRNLRAFGFNMFGEPERRKAMEKACDTGIPTITGKVKLVQEIGKDEQNGFLMFCPIYQNGIKPSTVEERREKLIGFAYSPFRANDLMKGVFGKVHKDIGFVLYHGLDTGPEGIIYDSGKNNNGVEPEFTSTSTIYLNGVPWMIEFYSLPGFINNEEKGQPLLVAIMVVVINILILFILLSLSLSNIKAKKLANDLQKEKERYELVSIATNDIIYDWNLENNKVSWNKNISKIFGLPFEDEEFTIDTWYNQIHPEDQKRVVSGIHKVIEGKQSQWMDEYRFRKSNGSYISILDRGYVLRNKNFKPYRMVGCMADITERKEQELKKDAFLGIASHELKTPLTSLKAFIQIIEKQLKENNYSQLAYYIEKTNRHINKLTALISDLLDVSKIQAGKLQLNISEFDITELIHECAGHLGYESPKHKITINKEADFKVKGDVARIEQVISNFLSNAIKYSPDADKVTIDVNREDDKVRVSITDYGVGIPRDKLSKVFTRFYRVEELSKKFAGLGLGLHIAAEIVKRHHGEVGVQSEPGKGSVFYFTIPESKGG